ncbi:GT2 family glycosyltransferase [Microterricola gilva]|uniref:GT2 family glycosyltransferase n=1 Tax=Microterricola gilva TaxID=393267 RepID=A0A4Q8AIR0_9MICO|nr:glycosyltransferase family 2 protein [Microterricola gilva]RZU64360.1 GT2 family glycosyltransferase [Microterricola gilva]
MSSPSSATAVSIDIVMPFYGSFDLLRAAVLSVQAQTDPDWRLTIVDDRYPDPEPMAWARTLNDPRITVVENAHNLGVSGNFTRSVELADADFAMIIGCDDILLPTYISRMRELAARFPDAAYLQPGVEVIDADGTVVLPLADRVKGYYRPTVSGPRSLSGETLATSLLRGNWTYFPSILWRTEVLKKHGFRSDLDVVLDLALQIEIVTDGGILVLDTVPTFRYRRHQASVSSWKASDGSRFREEQRYFLEAAAAMRELGWRRAAGAATRHVTSRLNAVTRLPSALSARDRSGIRSLLGHALSMRTSPRNQL